MHWHSAVQCSAVQIWQAQGFVRSCLITTSIQYRSAYQPVGDEMNVDINVVVQSGIVRYPALRYNEHGKPEFRFVLTRTTQGPDGHTFTLSIPCCAVAGTAEKLAGDLDEGMSIVITAGELVYRKRDTKEGEKSRLEILVWRAQVERSALAGVAQDERSDTDPSPGMSDDSANAPEPKVRRPRYPRKLSEPYMPHQN
jgi:single-stranded DNA-binding protein